MLTCIEQFHISYLTQISSPIAASRHYIRFKPANISTHVKTAVCVQKYLFPERFSIGIVFNLNQIAGSRLCMAVVNKQQDAGCQE